MLLTKNQIKSILNNVPTPDTSVEQYNRVREVEDEAKILVMNGAQKSEHYFTDREWEMVYSTIQEMIK